MDYNQSDQHTCEPSSSISSSSTFTSSTSSLFTSTSSTSTSSSSTGSCISSSTVSSNENYTREKIQHHLKYNKAEYIILNNSNNKNSSVCWRSFGFPAKLDINGVPQKIKNFVSCKNCFTTYSYASNSTTFLNKHNCLSSDRKTNSTLSSSYNTSSSQTLITTYGQPKTVRLPDSHSKDMKDLLVRWICKDMRPFATVYDDGLERYLCKRLDLTNLSDNPLDFWKNHKIEFPVLAKVACQIFSVPATSACVERSFSSAGNIVTKRRTNIKPTQLNNVLFLRSFYSFK